MKKKCHFTVTREKSDYPDSVLFNLKKDIGESHHVLDEYPGITERLAKSMVTVSNGSTRHSRLSNDD